MKRTGLILVGATVVIIGLLGGFSFAQTNNPLNSGMMQQKANINGGQGNYCGNNEEMIQIMKDNGFPEMTSFMESGDLQGMHEWMKNLSDEDYNRMLEVMQNNGYGNMANMMQSMGKEDMLKMHNSMMSGNGTMMSRMVRTNN